jgi:hypothetical protein
MGDFAIPCLVSNTKHDMDINSMISCKCLGKVMSLKFKVLFSSNDKAKSCNFGSIPLITSGQLVLELISK